MDLKFIDGYSITDVDSRDRDSYVELLNEKQIHDQTINIPYPYSPEDADWWINHVGQETKRLGRSVNWAIRAPGGKLAGGIGFHGFVPGRDHQAELGYWLAKPLWGKGLMTHAVRAACLHAFGEMGLERVTAHVFKFNVGSARVLEKSGFRREGELRKHYRKNGQFFDGYVYGLLKEDEVR